MGIYPSGAVLCLTDHKEANQAGLSCGPAIYVFELMKDIIDWLLKEIKDTWEWLNRVYPTGPP
ncbi:hypothetical protein LCGC14_0989590 [marine sediment metagenome]|uniref:Uncharacterized protein n=1 Tax=marine sediment metagenome TaxID=412755 RepID=A0A0F9NAS6_9ZZZZ